MGGNGRVAALGMNWNNIRLFYSINMNLFTDWNKN